MSINENRSIGKLISMIHRRFQIDINKELKQFDLNSSQYIFLIELYNEDHVSQDCLVKKLNIDKSATARAIKQLEDNGYVVRTVNPDDKRSYFIELTEKAVVIQSELYRILELWNLKLTENIDEKMYNTVLNSLQQMSEDLLRTIK
jgi:DNA-binding MarR family transcriptional regulator